MRHEHSIHLSLKSKMRTTVCTGDFAVIVIADDDVELTLRITGVETIERLLAAGIVAQHSMDRSRARDNLETLRERRRGLTSVATP